MRKNYVRGGLCWRCSWFRWSWSTLCHRESKQLIQVQASSVTVSNGKILIYKKIQSISEWHGKSLSWKMGSNSHLWQTEGFLQLGWLKGHQFLLRFIYLFIFAREKRRARGQNSVQVYSFCEKTEVTFSLEHCSDAVKDELTRTLNQTQKDAFGKKNLTNYNKFSSYKSSRKEWVTTGGNDDYFQDYELKYYSIIVIIMMVIDVEYLLTWSLPEVTRLF